MSITQETAKEARFIIILPNGVKYTSAFISISDYNEIMLFMENNNVSYFKLNLEDGKSLFLPKQVYENSVFISDFF